MSYNGALFDSDTTRVEVCCWNCNHSVTLRRGDVKADLDRHDFERRAICSQCQTGWPQTTKFPRRKPTSM
jgi:hypothetical protein